MMQDEVSETENIRKNLSIERMIVEGCDILLDVNQTFVRQGITFAPTPYDRRELLTGSSAIAEIPRCREVQFWQRYKLKAILCIKRCLCQKTKSIDVLHDKSTFTKNRHFAFLSPLWGLRGCSCCSSWGH